MSLEELETAVADLPREELAAFARRFEEYLADVWDRRIDEDTLAGRLDDAGREAEATIEAGRCKPLSLKFLQQFSPPPFNGIQASC